MSALASQPHPLEPWPGIPVQTYARAAGFLLLASLAAGGFGEAYVPSRIIAADAGTTMQNLRSYDSLLRIGFVAYLIEATCDIVLVMLFYALLRPVSRYISLLAAMFGLMGTALFAGSELFFFAPTLLTSHAGYLTPFRPEQVNAIALVSLRLFGMGAGLFMTFYGTGWILRGWLIWRSGYLPRFLGALMAITGTAFVGRNLQIVLAPTSGAGWFPVVMAPGMLTLMLWLMIKGVDETRWPGN
jgi:uncharacterized protein DUF4386